MALDALCMAALAQELRGQVLDGRVDKVYQPGRSQVVLAMRAGGGNVRLLLCGEPGQARAHLTKASLENPAQPPMFCMLLRKHLTGGRLTDISQPAGERILRFTFHCTDDLGDGVDRHLILEAIGPRANLIFTDGDDRILGCTRRVEGDIATGKRSICPGALYRLPEPHPGVPPLLGRELDFRGKDRAEGIARWETDIAQGRYAPTALVRDGKTVDFSFLPILQYGPATESVPFDTFGELLDEFYAHQAQDTAHRQRGGELAREVTALRERTARKVANQEQELAAAQDREGFREQGDLLTANLYRMSRGQSQVTVEDFFQESCPPRVIPLDPLLTPQQNAARYYKRYAKAKTAETVLTEQIAKGKADLDYLDSVLAGLQLAESERDVLEIRQELEGTGHLRAKKAAKRVMRVSPKFLEFTAPSGKRVSVGRNNTQNDQLTLKMAQKGDWWFHTQKTHGAHVILWCDGEAPTDADKVACAQLAAWYSQARESGKTAVDCTQVKFLKKPSGSPPGKVVYSTYETLMVEPKQIKDEKKGG